jgi:hypothetical protein
LVVILNTEVSELKRVLEYLNKAGLRLLLVDGSNVHDEAVPGDAVPLLGEPELVDRLIMQHDEVGVWMPALALVRELVGADCPEGLGPLSRPLAGLEVLPAALVELPEARLEVLKPLVEILPILDRQGD